MSTVIERDTKMSSAQSAAGHPIRPQSESELQVAARQARTRNRIWVWIGRIVVAVIFIGGWQLLTQTKVLDPFFYGQPTQIWDALVTLFADGTAFGSIWEQLLGHRSRGALRIPVRLDRRNHRGHSARVEPVPV